MQGSRIDIAERFGISQRDLRLLDPWAPMPFPISFMIRKHAILANLGAVRILISRSEARPYLNPRSRLLPRALPIA